MPKKGSDPVWCVVMFDLPVKTNKQRNLANGFRNQLLDLGFVRVQLSVYAQYLPLAARVSRIVGQIKRELPPGGDIRVINITDIQWSKAIRFSNAVERDVEEAPSQLLIF